MALLDSIKDGLTKILPGKHSGSSISMSGGIGSGHGMVGPQDDMIVPKITIVFHASQVFFNFLAMCCFAGVASFQAKFGVGPSGLTGFTIFLTVTGMFLSLFMLLIPVLYEKYDKFIRLARALKEVRVGFILTGTGTVASLLISFIVTISAWTQPGCKDPERDPNAKEKGDDFKKGLPGWCSTKKAGAVFLWLAFVFWAASLGYLIYLWRTGKLHGPRDPPFTRPEGSTAGYGREEDDEETDYHVVPPVRRQTSETTTAANPFSDSNRYSGASGNNAANTTPYSRPSMDAYGAFDDPPPSGFAMPSPTSGRPGFASPPVIPEQDFGPKVSRTMQYADPYAAVRASVAAGQQQNQQGSTTPPSYESYQGYR